MGLRFAVLGAGRIGQVHAKAITSVKGAELVAMAEPVPEAADAAKRAFGVEIREIDACASAEDIDAVVICTPTDTHSDLIEQFVRAGKAVFCEKPIDLSLERVKSCLKVVDAEGGKLMVGFNRRFDPDFRALKATISAGQIGEVEMIAITSRDPSPPPVAYIERSGGMFRDMTIHDFDVARWLLGEEIDTVIASASNLVDPAIKAAGDFDSANVILTTASGKQCTINNSRRATYGYDQRIEVHGSTGMIAAGNKQKSNVTLATKSGYAGPPLMDFFMDRYAEAYATEITQFVTAVAAGSPMPATGHDGMMALALADAAMKSVAEARAVKMSEIL